MLIAILFSCTDGSKTIVDTSNVNDTSDTSNSTTQMHAWEEIDNVHFSSGFEGNLSISMNSDGLFGDITGSDSLTMNDFQSDLEQLPFGEFRFYFEGGTEDERFIDRVPDPDNPENMVLLTQINKANVNVSDDDTPCNGETVSARKSRIQGVLRDNVDLTSFEYQVRFRLGDGFNLINSQSSTLEWMTIGEFWNNLANVEDPFRITIGVHKLDSGPGLSLIAKADDRVENPDGSYDWNHVWPSTVVAQSNGTPIIIEPEQWYTMHVELKEGNASSGYFSVKIAESGTELETVIEVNDFTHHPEPTVAIDGFRDINPIKLYTFGQVACDLNGLGNALQIYWDDFAIGIPN